MGPQACFDKWLAEKDYPQAVLYVNSYHHWVTNGGFKAKDSLGREVDRLKVEGQLLPKGMKKTYRVFTGGQWRWITIYDQKP